jgi:hypothetical protein
MTKLKSRLGERPDQKQQPDNITKPTIKTIRQLRFLSGLLGGEMPIHDLRNMAGSENIWQECKVLRAQGWIIHTDSKPFVDRDGQKVRSGYYSLDPSQREIAIKLIAGWKP